MSYKQDADIWREEAHKLNKTIAAMEKALAKRKAQWQLEAMAALFNRARETGDLAGSYSDMRNEIRQHANRKNND